MNLKRILTFSALALTSYSTAATDISLDSIKKDITFLAHDDLKGRASFTVEAEQAADYIAQRFKNIGLLPYKGTFKHTFPVYVRQVTQVDVALNGKVVADKHLAIVTTAKNVSWHQGNTNVSTHRVAAEDSLGEKLSELNLQGGNHLVLVDVAHEKMFGRYKHYFERPKTSLSDDNTGTLVLALTKEDQANHFLISAQSQTEKKKLTNVSGLLPGRSKDYEVVLFSAHYDHIGMLQQDEEGAKKTDVIFNGADDDASGTTAVINLAQHFKDKNDNERSLMFVAFAAEEIGGFGSQFFSKQLPVKNIMAMINLEMIGKPSKFGHGKVWMTGIERSDLGDIMNDALKPHDTEIFADPYPKQKLFYRSDNATLARLGVPAHSFSSTQLDKDPHYHKVSDEVSTLDLESMKKVIDTIARAVEPIVAAEATPSRLDATQVNAKGKIF
ncbi:M20/M25/M40 family metallo-hydrolase [Parashewanella spongiae]|uniref:M20/M25/M40 family metallo-hydrolase n=1 Tax=Parashewanella spongiae TaxID=342950 RepID=A0A3A6TP53_9GAMM|nr:M20/M25/M40 family metallo-hydrolase [Parashewanella spongiae]MCL1078546.1 M20/M25/M40 family metallo-hydrolase [Parashewanella spongiae]RJY13318.1 M20/M25/M40 family metallo-hydrolase [Parashewanella spongiae]